MSTGSVRSPPPGGAPASTSVTCWPFSCLYRQNGCPSAGRAAGTAGPGSDVEEPDVLRVALDEGAACLHVLAHQHAEQLVRSEEHTSELQSRRDLVCRLLLEKK